MLRVVLVKTKLVKFIEILCEEPSPVRDSFMYAIDSSQKDLKTIPIVKEFQDSFMFFPACRSPRGKSLMNC